ncbi:hypothetical protein L208DRAFT_735211 [Tricholoma matsutake]|nr:hypothetical protein L208DRAFT_735211 [Tricholoma matsutake 945]
MKHQKLKSTRQTPCPQTAELTDDHSSSQRFTIKLPAHPLVRAGTPSTADRLGSTVTQSWLPVVSTSQ